MQETDFALVYSGNIAQVDLLKCVLEGEGIQAFLPDEFIGTIAPYTASAGGVGPVKVIVAKSNVREARLIVEDFVNTAPSNHRKLSAGE